MAFLQHDPNAAMPVQPMAQWRVRFRHVLTICATIGVCFVAGQWYRYFSAPVEPDSGPLLVAIRSIGELHSASYAMKDVARQESQEEPEGVFRALPGADTLTHWATRNRALVAVEGTVEAGIDLRRLSAAAISREKQSDGTTLLRVHLPPVVIYPPNVHVRVENHQRGLLWRDENIAPKAQAEAAQRFLAAAEADGIRRRAQCSAVETLQKMQNTLGDTHVIFTF